jgi:hypothetical protein
MRLMQAYIGELSTSSIGGAERSLPPHMERPLKHVKERNIIINAFLNIICSKKITAEKSKRPLLA